MLVGLFFVRAVLWADGLRFRDRLVGQLQLIDEPLLREDPFRAFTSLNIQPPLWNFYVGAVRRWSPLPDAFSFQVIWLGLSVATALMMWRILTTLGARRWQATVATILVVNSPMYIQNESSLRYEMLVTFIVTASVFTFMRFIAQPSVQRFGGLTVVLVAGVLTRTLLQPFWLIAGMVVAIVLVRRQGMKVGRYVAFASCVVLALIAQLGFLHARYGTFGYSSYVGENMQRIAVMTLPNAEFRKLRSAGKLSEFAAIKPYSHYSAYEGGLARCVVKSHDPALHDVTKSTGEPNLNSVCFQPVYRTAMRDSLAAIRADPANYANSVVQATLMFTGRYDLDRTPDVAAFRALKATYTPILLPVRVDYWFGGDHPQPLTSFLRYGTVGVPIFLMVGAALIAALWQGGASAIRLLRHRNGPALADVTKVWIGLTVFMVTIVGVGFDFFENGRFREALDPIVLGPFYVAIMALAVRLGQRLRTRLTPRDSGGNL